MAVASAAPDRATYLRRPDLGRKLNDDSRRRLTAEAASEHEAVFVIADGLSALAVHRHAVPLLEIVLPRLQDWRLAPVIVAEQGRVAIGDEIGQTLKAQLVVVVLGERPGLTSPDSLGLYVTWNPKLGRTDAERNCISNIRGEGLSCAMAADKLFLLMAKARRQKLTGVNLKDSDSRELEA